MNLFFLFFSLCTSTTVQISNYNRSKYSTYNTCKEQKRHTSTSRPRLGGHNPVEVHARMAYKSLAMCAGLFPTGPMTKEKKKDKKQVWIYINIIA